uniref:Uncharacterized protein n=1 Tax=Tanacetum cinerariifolium TaxID=118510 RepID=A0A6L2KGX0_TANCI|nr:hypothetical protein [Tanacetum cinerariifolium]
MGYYFYFPPENKVIVTRSERTTRAPNRLSLNIEVEDDEVGDLGEAANYKDAMIDPDKVFVMRHGNVIKMIKSQTGYVFVVNEGAVDWKSKKQTIIAMHLA